jgi:hypothetical protein
VDVYIDRIVEIEKPVEVIKEIVIEKLVEVIIYITVEKGTNNIIEDESEQHKYLIAER